MDTKQEIREILEDFDASFAEKSEGGREEVYKQAIEALSALIEREVKKQPRVGFWSNPNLVTVNNVLYTRKNPVELPEGSIFVNTTTTTKSKWRRK